MNKIIITNIEEKTSKTNVKFWSCLDSVGNKYTCWDADIAQSIINNLNKECNCEIKISGNYKNIRAFNVGNIEVRTGELPISMPTQTAKAEYGNVAPKLYSQKDISIIAQVMVKAVMGQPLNFANDLKTVKDAVEMYKEAVKLLEND